MGLAEIFLGLDKLGGVLCAAKHTAWRKQHTAEAAELRKESEALKVNLNARLARTRQGVGKTEDPDEGWRAFSSIAQTFGRLHSRFEDLCFCVTSARACGSPL